MNMCNLRLLTKLQCFLSLMVLFCINPIDSQRSPCPNVFKYFRDSRSNVIYGKITIPNPSYGTHKLDITMSLKAPLSGNFGSVVLRNEHEISRVILGGQPLIYTVNFPLTRPLPVLTQLKFKGALLCVGPPEKLTGPGQHVTTIKLQHTLNAKLVHKQIQTNNPSYHTHNSNDYEVEIDNPHSIDNFATGPLVNEGDGVFSLFGSNGHNQQLPRTTTQRATTKHRTTTQRTTTSARPQLFLAVEQPNNDNNSTQINLLVQLKLDSNQKIVKGNAVVLPVSSL